AQVRADARVGGCEPARDAEAVGEEKEILQRAGPAGGAQHGGATGEDVIGTELPATGEQRCRQAIEARVVLAGAEPIDQRRERDRRAVGHLLQRGTEAEATAGLRRGRATGEPVT